MSPLLSWLIVAGIAVAAFVASRLSRPDEVAQDDWTLPLLRRPVLDRAELLELPYSPFVSDEEALALLAEIRALPEVAA